MREKARLCCVSFPIRLRLIALRDRRTATRRSFKAGLISIYLRIENCCAKILAIPKSFCKIGRSRTIAKSCWRRGESRRQVYPVTVRPVTGRRGLLPLAGQRQTYNPQGEFIKRGDNCPKTETSNMTTPHPDEQSFRPHRIKRPYRGIENDQK